VCSSSSLSWSLESEAPLVWINKNFIGHNKGCEDATRLPDEPVGFTDAPIFVENEGQWRSEENKEKKEKNGVCHVRDYHCPDTPETVKYTKALRIPVEVLLDIPCARPVHTLFDLNVELQLIEEGKRYPFVHGHLAPAWRERIEEIEGLKKTLAEAKRHATVLRGASEEQLRSTTSSAMQDLLRALGLGYILEEERAARASWGVGATHT